MQFDSIHLSPVIEEHIEVIRKWRNNPEVSQYMNSSQAISGEDQLSWFNKISIDETCMYWMVFDKAKPVGVVNLADISRVNKRCSWGFYLGELAFRVKGIGAKVEFLILDYVFQDLQLEKLCGEVLSFNESALKLHENFGFLVEGRRLRHVVKDDNFYDVIEIAHFKEKWSEDRVRILKLLGKKPGIPLK